MIVTDLELKREMARAETKGNSFVAIAHVDRETGKLNVFYKMKDFPRADIPGVLNRLADMLEPEVAASAKNNP